MRNKLLIAVLALISLGSFAQDKANVFTGSGAPEGKVQGNAGDVYIRSEGTIYTKNTGPGKTGWVANPSASLPAQTSHANQLLTTDGSNAAWSGPKLTFDSTLGLSLNAPLLLDGCCTNPAFTPTHGLNVQFTSTDGSVGVYSEITDSSNNGAFAFLGKFHTANVAGSDDGSEFQMYVENPSGTKSFADAAYFFSEMDGAGTIDKLTNIWLAGVSKTAGTVNNAYSLYDAGESVGANNFGHWISDMTNGGSGNNYYLWFDSPGVYRVRADYTADTSSFPQAIPALYNPRFAKYTPGAADYERIVEQWVSNVAQIGVEVGGTGTSRDLSLIGAHIRLPVASLSGTRFLCVNTIGVVSASASACSGT